MADAFFWSNTVSGVWSEPGNWTNAVGVAVAPESGGQAAYTLSFNKAGTYTAINDLGNGFLLNRLTAGGPSLTLAGHGLVFTNDASALPQLNQNGSSTVTISNSLAFAANMTLGGNGSGGVMLRGPLAGPGSLTKTNAAALTITYGTNTYSGGTVIQAGTVNFQDFNVNTTSLLGTGPVTVNSAATLALNRTYLTNRITFNGGTVTSGNSFSSTLAGPMVLEATPTFNISGGISVSGKMSGPGGVIKSGNSMLPLSGSNSFTGAITVNAGTLKAASLNSVSGGAATSNLGAPADAASGMISLGSGGTAATLIYNGPGETSDRIIQLSGATGGATLTQSGTASGLPAPRGTSGLLKLTGGLSVPGVASVDNRKTLTLTHATDANTGGTPGCGEFCGTISDSVQGAAGQRATSVTKAGVGLWTLSGANTYGGVTRIQAGTLAFTRADALGTNALDITDGAKAQLDYVGTRQVAALTFNAGTALPAGSYGSSRSLATFKDDAHFSGLGTVTVGTIASPTSTTLVRTGGVNPAAAGVSLIFTATVSGAAPTGNVIFYDGVTALGTNSLDGSFHATIAVSTLTGGSHILTALYVGDNNNGASASEGLPQTVTESRLPTTTTVARTSGGNPSAKGSAVTFAATVAGDSPSGSVTFYDGAQAFGSAALNASSQAILTVTSLAPGWHPVTARYGGDANNAPSASTPPVVQTVNPSTGNGKVKVFILAGQSNMVGKGRVETGHDPNNLSGTNIVAGLGSLRHMLNANPDKYGYLADPDHPLANGSPGWMTRPDVWITYYGGAAWAITAPLPTPPYYTAVRKGDLDANFGENAVNGLIGPEYGFGLVVGSQVDDQVLIIKYAHGGRSLAVDFRPPTSVQNAGGTVGPCYNEMKGVVHQVLDNIAAEFPAYAGGGYEVVGLGWHQGWNDRINASYVAEYETNMVNLIKDLRVEFGAPNMRVSIATTGMANADSDANARNLIAAQNNVANPALHPEFAGTVSTVDTRPFDFGTLRGTSDEGYHWNWSGESYFNIGESMGLAMVAMLPPSGETTNSIVNVEASEITTNAVTLTALLACPVAGLDVYAHWNTVNGGTEPSLWTNAVYAGSFTNVSATNLSVRVTGLNPNTSYFFTFRATNAMETLWAPEALEFATPGLPNLPPVIAEGAVTNVVISEDSSPVPFSLILQASDSDGGTLVWSVITNAQHGIATSSGAGASWGGGYTPFADYNGTDTFAVQVSDGQGGTDTITVNVIIQSVNDTPVTNGISTAQTLIDADCDGRQAVILDASAATDTDGSIVSYIWKEGAVELATGRVSTVNFAVGIHAVTLEIRDDGGALSTLQMTITISPLKPYLVEDFEHEWSDNALVTSTNQWTASGQMDRSSITNLPVGLEALPTGAWFPLAYNHATSRRVLKVDTQGDSLMTPSLQADFANSKLYVDMIAVIGLAGGIPEAVSNDVRAKASVFLREIGGSTNLVVFHGQKTSDGFGAPVFTTVGDGFDPEAWYRLTVTFDATTNNGGAEAFCVRINGNLLVSPEAYSDSWKTRILSEPFSPDGGSWFLSASRRLGASGTNQTMLTELVFDGEGIVDDLQITPYQPLIGHGTTILIALSTGSGDDELMN